MLGETNCGFPVLVGLLVHRLLEVDALDLLRALLDSLVLGVNGLLLNMKNIQRLKIFVDSPPLHGGEKILQRM